MASETDPAEDGRSEKESWRDRKKAGIDRLRDSSREVKIVALGDKLSNMRAIARDYAVQGDGLWSIFHAPDPKDHAWRYHALADALRELDDTPAFREFETLVEQVFGK